MRERPSEFFRLISGGDAHFARSVKQRTRTRVSCGISEKVSKRASASDDNGALLHGSRFLGLPLAEVKGTLGSALFDGARI